MIEAVQQKHPVLNESISPRGWNRLKIEGIRSPELNRIVDVEVFTPPGYNSETTSLPLLLLNDGQDSEPMQLLSILNDLSESGEIAPFIVAGVFCGDRLQEYGVSGKPDYKKRGASAAKYAHFITEHLFPALEHKFGIKKNHPGNAIAGYSLGGLSAFDMAWNHPKIFPRVAAFSGSFWWRRKALDKGYTEADRIMHRVLRKSKLRPGMKFWFMAGTAEETADRNNNGIIDTIDDTLDLIAELVTLGYKPYYDIHYHEVKGGEHNVPTWGKAMPYFLKWAFGRKD
ncbi:MAG: esterase family protein [Bacteroidetes bacterium]|nr:esterase family protein [Bacteroidota bacterium]